MFGRGWIEMMIDDGLVERVACTRKTAKKASALSFAVRLLVEARNRRMVESGVRPAEIVPGAAHFLQEDKGPEIAARIARFVTG